MEYGPDKRVVIVPQGYEVGDNGLEGFTPKNEEARYLRSLLKGFLEERLKMANEEDIVYDDVWGYFVGRDDGKSEFEILLKLSIVKNIRLSNLESSEDRDSRTKTEIVEDPEELAESDIMLAQAIVYLYIDAIKELMNRIDKGELDYYRLDTTGLEADEAKDKEDDILWEIQAHLRYQIYRIMEELLVKNAEGEPDDYYDYTGLPLNLRGYGQTPDIDKTGT